MDENEANEAEAKKRSKDVTPASASRLTKQPKTRGTDETHEKDARRTLFKSPPDAKRERWKRQQASVEERSMQAATPATAKKKPTVSTKAQTLSKKMDTQLQQAQSMMDKMQKALAEQDHPPYIAEMQQQMQSTQETMGQLEEITTNLRQDVTDVEMMANYVHDTLYKQQQQEVALQTVAKGWPTAFSDSERDSVISWYADKAGVANHFTTTHGRYTYGKYNGKQNGPKTLLRPTFTSTTTDGGQ